MDRLQIDTVVFENRAEANRYFRDFPVNRHALYLLKVGRNKVKVLRSRYFDFK
ncbi:MAG: hypothetical protein ACTSPD_10010 [Promethearchaeota archaeon]